MLKKYNNLLIAIDSVYALSDNFFLELKKINSLYPIDFLLINTAGNINTIQKIKKLILEFKNAKIIEINRINNLNTLFKALYTIVRKFLNKEYIVLMGSNINPEERLLIKTLSKKSIYFGLMPTTPPIIRQFVFDDLNNINKNLKDKSIFFFDNIQEIIYRVFKKLFFIFYAYDIDQVAIRNGYVNYNLAKAHFTINNYWAFLLKNEYQNQNVIVFDDYYEIVMQDYIFNTKQINDNLSLLILGPVYEESFIVIFNSINNLKNIFSINKISVRPHPSHLDISKKFELFLKINYQQINIVTCDIPFYDQAQQYDIILSYASSALNSILRNKNIYIIIDELYNEIEFGLPGVNPHKIVGSYYGFNKEYSFLDPSGNWYCKYISPVSSIEDHKKVSFYDAFVNEINKN